MPTYSIVRAQIKIVTIVQCSDRRVRWDIANHFLIRENCENNLGKTLAFYEYNKLSGLRVSSSNLTI